MGCCVSRTEGPNSPYPGDPNSSSARAINHDAQQHQQQPSSPTDAPGASSPTTATPNAEAGDAAVRVSSAPSPPADTIPVQSRRRSRRENQPLEQHINKPLRRHVWISKNRNWTRATIDRERADFFDTRVTGRPEVWQTIHAALRVLWDPVGQGASDDGTNGIATAQGFLEAAELTLPTGDLAQGVYDALGNYYPLPEWVVADPENLAPDSNQDESRGTDTKAEGSAVDSNSSEEMDDDKTVQPEEQKDEKGKEVVGATEQISVHARLSENAKDVVVKVAKDDTVKHLARKILDKSGLPETRKIRIAYMGKILKDSSSISDQGYQPGHVVNALVFER